MIELTVKEGWGPTERWLSKLKSEAWFRILDKYGSVGVAALANATPSESGLTAASWYYEIVHRHGYHAIHWHNGNMVDGIPVAVMIQYGHGTGTGGYVQGRDYIMPAIRPVFEQIVSDIIREVRSL
jgi:hypothetical protein